VLRKAILIGHNNASAMRNGALRGANKDMTDIQTFLLSDHGGAWEYDEIDWYRAPSLAELRGALARVKLGCDYVLIAFSGHGAHDRGSFVMLNEDEAIFVKELAEIGAKARKILVISDACRVQATVPVALPPRTAAEDVAGIPDDSYRRSCRTAFNNVLRKAPEGVVVMHACSKGESAGDSPQGGVFTQALLRSASQWALSESNYFRAHRTLYAHGAFNLIEMPEQRRARLGAQTPCISPQVSPKFPLAIA
jgi:hypothetical protein